MSPRPKRAVDLGPLGRGGGGHRDRRQLVIPLMGYSSGMPFLLTSAVLSYWMTKVGVDLTTIGIFVLVGTPYAF